jgi:hypothetical protein
VLTKPFYKSWTLWFNILMAVAMAIQAVSPYLPVPAWLLADATIFANFLLRLKTNSAIIGTQPTINPPQA